MSKTIGIIGGMGPLATLELQRRILNFTQANCDHQHLRLLVDNNPQVPSRIKALAAKGPSPLPVLTSMALGLVQQGAQLLAMPCNTAHHYYAPLAQAVNVPLINMLEVSAQVLGERFNPGAKVGLLASSSLVEAELYSEVLAAQGLQLVVPDSRVQQQLMAMILAVKAGERVTAQSLVELVEPLSQQVDCLLVGCSELSIVAGQEAMPVAVVDSLDCLAKALVLEASA